MDAPLKSWLPLLLAWPLCCTPVPSKPGHYADTDSMTKDDAGPDADTDTDTGFPGASFVAPTEDLLPDWSLNWAWTTGGLGGDRVLALARVETDTFVAVGNMLDSEEADEMISFGGTMIPTGPDNMFLAKYDIEGKVLWARWAGDGLYASGHNVDAFPDGRLAVAGWCEDEARFGPGEPNETLVLTGNPLSPYDTPYFAVFEQNGDLAWVRSFLLTEYYSRAECMAMRTLEDGAMLATGQFDVEVVAGAGTATETTLVRHPDGVMFQQNVFLVKYDPDGDLVWARREGGPGHTAGTGLAVLPDGAFFLAGGFEGTAVFGEGQENETTLVAMGTESVFLARYDAEGFLEWVNDLGVDGEIRQWHKTGNLLLLSNGDVAIPGSYSGSMLAGDGDDVQFVDAETWGMFLARYSPHGDRIWTRVMPSNGPAGQFMGGYSGIAELQDETLVAVGAFNGSMIFGAGEPNEITLHSGSEIDAIIVAFSPSGDFLWALPQGGSRWDIFRGIVHYPGETPEKDIIIVGGGFSSTVTFGTGGDDTITLTATPTGCYWPYDIILLRFDREAN